MPTPSRPAARTALDRARLGALLFGSLIGCVAWGLLAVPDAGSYQLAMALIMIAAGSASFVAYALHQRGVTWRRGAAAARVWICALGSGVCLAMLGMQWVMG